MADSLSLVVGDRVVYPNQGLCKVTGIEAKEVAGQKLRFVTLVREEDGAKVMVPEAKVTAIGVRKVADADDVTRVMAFLKSDSDKASLDWKARARTNTERMATGGLIGLAEVVKGLQVLSELRPLPPKERELYNDARHLLVTELAAALKIEGCDAEDTLDVVLFPVGKDRPKRTAEEFRVEDEFGEDDLLGFEGEAAEEEVETKAEAEPAEGEEAAEGEGEAGEEKPKKKPGRPPKEPKAEAAPRKPLLSDIEVTVPAGSPLLEPVKRKRGRPPKPKPPPPEHPPPPKKRGRPPKPKPAEPVHAEPKKRGRPPKKK